MTYRDGLLEGEVHEWTVDRKLTLHDRYERGRRLGRQVESSPEGRKVMEGDYYHAGDVSKVAFDWAEARYDVSVVDSLASDQRTGVWTWWHPNGQKKLEGQYRDDVPEGLFTWYYSHAQKQRAGHYHNGQQHGLWTTWHANGQKESEGQFVAGEAIGEWLAWNTSGQRVQLLTKQGVPSGNFLR